MRAVADACAAADQVRTSADATTATASARLYHMSLEHGMAGRELNAVINQLRLAQHQTMLACGLDPARPDPDRYDPDMAADYGKISARTVLKKGVDQVSREVRRALDNRHW